MKMTELFMLQDSSEDHANTWEFLRNRMDEAVQIQSMLSETEGMTHSFTRSFNSAFITVSCKHLKLLGIRKLNSQYILFYRHAIYWVSTTGVGKARIRNQRFQI